MLNRSPENTSYPVQKECAGVCPGDIAEQVAPVSI
jgi:hypothetical protein